MSDQRHLLDLDRPLAAELLEEPGEPPAVLGDVEARVVAQVERAEAEVVAELLAVGSRRRPLHLGIGLGAEPPRLLRLAQAVDEDREPRSRVVERLLDRRAGALDVAVRQTERHLHRERTPLLFQPIADQAVDRCLGSAPEAGVADGRALLGAAGDVARCGDRGARALAAELERAVDARGDHVVRLLDDLRALADRSEDALGDGGMDALDGAQKRFVCISPGKLAERFEL